MNKIFINPPIELKLRRSEFPMKFPVFLRVLPDKKKLFTQSVFNSLVVFFLMITLTETRAQDNIALAPSHKEKVEELFEHDLEKHGNKNRLPMFTIPLNKFTSDKKQQAENATKEEERYKKLLDRIIKLETQLAEKENTKSEKVNNKPPEDWEEQLDKDLDSQKKRSDKQKVTASPEADNKGNSEDWEEQLERELKQQKVLSQKSQNSRNTNSPAVQTPQTSNQNSQNLMMDINAAVDIVGQWDKNKKSTTTNSLDVREAEFGFNAAVDQVMRGTLLVAAHNEDGKSFFEIHEAKAQFPFLIKNISASVGQMFLDQGRLNRIHRHDRPFTESPIVHRKLMAEESTKDTGAEVNILFPWKTINQELVVGATNGRVWGHSHSDGPRKNNPMVYAHLKNFYYFGNNWGTQFGITGIRYEPDQNTRTVRNQYGADIVVKWNRSFLKSFQFMAEVWLRETEFPYERLKNNKPETDRQIGYYAFADYQFDQQWFVGFRYDYFSVTSLRDKYGYRARNAEIAYTPQITYKPSEFSYIRASLERRYTKDFTIDSSKIDFRPLEDQLKDYSENGRVDKASPTVVSYQFYIQCVFILGSHPPHVY
ncbi:MAG: hypothetical protein KBA66_08085 [Leptospiraceae bacterium]|nr:hypothetical protein [Leptospiraceae bacterium]